jgi:hypothetical protein
MHLVIRADTTTLYHLQSFSQTLHCAFGPLHPSPPPSLPPPPLPPPHPHPQALPHGSVLPSTTMDTEHKEHQSMGESVAEGVANADQVCTLWDINR